MIPQFFLPGIRAKLIAIFVLIKLVPLIFLAWFAWIEIFILGDTIEEKYVSMVADTGEVVKGVTDLSTENTIQALDQKSREAIERLTTDTARAVAAFLDDRDRDIELASYLPVEKALYEKFLSARYRPVVLHDEWVMDPSGEAWVPNKLFDPGGVQVVSARNDDNRRDFSYRAPEHGGIVEHRPTYLEMTFVDMNGREKIKVTTSDILPDDLRDISDPGNTYCRAERYFQAFKALKPGEIYVSEVIGPYVKTHIIGIYSRTRAALDDIEFAPQKSGYAGKENPVGIRFQGLVRWAAPVVRGGRIIGYVTLALDHTHLMEFTDHIVPTNERYSPISDASSGNYAFMWDYLGRNISHPRDYFIVGYDPQTGEQAVPWLDEEMYKLWLQCDRSMSTFQQQAPRFKEQSLSKMAALPLTNAGMVGLDGRYLNFAPQCTGWRNLTQFGGSGSFLIFWGGLWKLSTAAAIPYYTGRYGKHARGFGYVTIGANVDEFHRPAIETANTIQHIEARYNENLENAKQENKVLIKDTLQKAFKHLSYLTGIMIVVVIGIAVLIAAVLTRRITYIINGIHRFQEGDRGYRLEAASNDEMGQLTDTFNNMADTVQQYIGDMELSREQVQQINERLTEEIEERRQAQHELSRHRDNLEDLVRERTQELESEIVERKRVETLQSHTEERLRQQNKTLMHLAGKENLHTGDLNGSLQDIMEAAAKTLQVERSSVWLLDENQTTGKCHEIYILSADRHYRRGEFDVADYALYVETLRSSRTIAVSDASADGRLIDFREWNMPSLDIRSMLDAAIIEGGDMVGLVRFEQVKTTRQWHIDEQNFAHSVADLMALAIGARKRKQEVKEKEQLEVRLRRAEKMEAIGTLAGGVAHDLNNILSGIVSYPELLLHKMPADSAMRKPIETILNAGKRASDIVQDLLTLARRGVDVTEVINLNDIVEEYLRSPEHKKITVQHPHIHIRTHLSPDLLNIAGSVVHLSKSLMNLVINAAEAIEGTGEIIISTRNSYIDRPIKGYDMVNEGDYVALSVEDTGIGISPEEMNRIFEPFYSKKKMGRSGTGLGMAVVWGAVKDHHGYIDSYSREGRGSRFTLYFPVTRKILEKTRSVAVEEYLGHGETILVVDDIPEQRQIASAILEELGYQVTVVSSGEKAVEYLKEHSVDLLLLDMVMEPGMDGMDTFQAVISFRPKQKAIIASGYSETARIKEVQRLGASHYIRKPYTMEKIGVTVREALNGR